MESSTEFAAGPFILASFVPHVGTGFTISRPGVSPCSIVLITAEPINLNPRDGRALGKSGDVRTDPFTLLFRGELDNPLRQGLYDFEHDVMGRFVMSIVPVGPGEGGMLYEAVIN